MHHLVLHVAIDEYSGVSFNRLLSQLLLTGGKIGVNCFVLITGFFEGGGIRIVFGSLSNWI